MRVIPKISEIVGTKSFNVLFMVSLRLLAFAISHFDGVAFISVVCSVLFWLPAPVKCCVVLLEFPVFVFIFFDSRFNVYYPLSLFVSTFVSSVFQDIPLALRSA